MPERRILYLGPHQPAMPGEVAACSEGAFESTPEGIARSTTTSPQTRKRFFFTLVVNLAEESFQLETIPFLQGTRPHGGHLPQLSQLFYTTPTLRPLARLRKDPTQG